jgi:phospholipid N-methyltransferase
MSIGKKRTKAPKVSLLTFSRQAFSDFEKTAAIVPSSRYLVQAMTEPLPLVGANVVVEFGPGTGAMTRELLRLTPVDAIIVAFEVNPRFVAWLRGEFTDRRLKVIECGAEHAACELRRLGIGRVDAVLSSLGFSLMQDNQVHETLSGLLPFMTPQSVFTQFQYLSQVRLQRGRIERYRVSGILADYFTTVRRTLVWRNVPPAFAFECRR